MTEKIIDINTICGDKIYTRDDGHVLYNAVDDALKHYDKAIVQFNEKEIASESFLDEAIVEHYLRPQHDDVTNRIVLQGVSKSDQILLKKIFEYRKRLEDKEAKKLAKTSKKKRTPPSHLKKKP